MPDLMQPAVRKPTQVAFAPETVLYTLYARSSETTDDHASDQKKRVIMIMPPYARERGVQGGEEKNTLHLGWRVGDGGKQLL